MNSYRQHSVAKQGDNALGSVRLFVHPSICLSVQQRAIRVILSLKVCSGRRRPSNFFVCELCFIGDSWNRSMVNPIKNLSSTSRTRRRFYSFCRDKLTYETEFKLRMQLSSNSAAAQLNLNNRSWGLFWPRRNKTRHLKGCDGVRNDRKTHVGVKKDPRTCLTWLFFGPVIKVKGFRPQYM